MNKIKKYIYKIERGFTLIELVITVIIISILSAIGLSVIKFDRTESFLSGKAKQFVDFYAFALDEAILNSQLIRIRLDNNLLSMEKKTNENWEKVKLDSRYSNFSTDDRGMSVKISDSIFLFPSGRSSTVTVDFLLDEFAISYQIDGLGRVTKVKNKVN